MSPPLEALISALMQLPGIGRKTAQRLAFYLLKNPRCAQKLEESLVLARNHLHLCAICFNITDQEICSICADPGRNPNIVCVVEEPAAVMVVEQTGQYRGKYHILGGAIAPLDDVTPENLHIKELISRVEREKITEVIIATNPTTEGEASAIYIAQLLKPKGVKVTRIARGLPVGSDLELADRETITRAFEGRREI